MSTYVQTWDCCDSETRTQAWIPEECPFCTQDPAGWIAAWATEWRWQEAVRAADAYAQALIVVANRPPASERMRLHYEGWAWGACGVSNRAHEALGVEVAR